MSLASLHVHLDHDTCLEVTVLRGRSDDVQRFGEHVIAERGVRHGKLVRMPTEPAGAGGTGAHRAHRHPHGHDHRHDHEDHHPHPAPEPRTSKARATRAHGRMPATKPRRPITISPRTCTACTSSKPVAAFAAEPARLRASRLYATLTSISS